MELAFLTQAGVFGLFPVRDGGGGFILFIKQGDSDLLRIRQAQGQFIFMNPQFQRIPHGGKLHEGDLGAGNDAHIEEMLAQGALSADGINPGGLAGFQFIQVHQYASSLLRAMSISDKYDTTNLSGCNGKKH